MPARSRPGSLWTVIFSCDHAPRNRIVLPILPTRLRRHIVFHPQKAPMLSRQLLFCTSYLVICPSQRFSFLNSLSHRCFPLNSPPRLLCASTCLWCIYRDVFINVPERVSRCRPSQNHTDEECCQRLLPSIETSVRLRKIMYVSLSAKVRSTHVVMKCKVQRFDQSRQVLSKFFMGACP